MTCAKSNHAGHGGQRPPSSSPHASMAYSASSSAVIAASSLEAGVTSVSRALLVVWNERGDVQSKRTWIGAAEWIAAYGSSAALDELIDEPLGEESEGEAEKEGQDHAMTQHHKTETKEGDQRSRSLALFLAIPTPTSSCIC